MLPLSRHGMRHLGPMLAFALFAALPGCGGGVATTSSTSAGETDGQAPRPRGGLVVPPDRLDFGEVSESRSFTWSLPIQNASAQTIRVKDFEASCDCVSIAPASLDIAPGASETVILTLDLTRRSRDDQGRAIRPYSAFLRPTLEGTEIESPVWRIEGRVRKCIELSPSYVYCGPIDIRAMQAYSARILVKTPTPARRIVASCDTDTADVVVVPVGTPRSIRMVEVTFHEARQPGPFTVKIDIVAELEDGIPCQATAIIEGDADADGIVSIPASLSLGSVTLGQSSGEVVTIKSLAEQPFRVSHVECDENVRADCIKNDTAEVQYAVSVRVGQTGHFEKRIRFHLDRSEGEPTEHDLLVTGYGFATDVAGDR